MSHRPGRVCISMCVHACVCGWWWQGCEASSVTGSAAYIGDIELHHSEALSVSLSTCTVSASHTSIQAYPTTPLHLSPVMPPCPGFVDLADLVAAILSEGLVRPKAEGFMSRIGQFFTEDARHHVSHAVNRSARNAFYGVFATDSLADVRTSNCPGVACTRLRCFAT